jgi:hypothetical protein
MAAKAFFALCDTVLNSTASTARLASLRRSADEDAVGKGNKDDDDDDDDDDDVVIAWAEKGDGEEEKEEVGSPSPPPRSPALLVAPFL